jgi:hypothetical protein
MKTFLIATGASVLTLLILGAGFGIGAYSRLLSNQHSVSVVTETVIGAANRITQIEQINRGATNDLAKSLNQSLNGDILVIDMFLNESVDLTDETRKMAHWILIKIADMRELGQAAGVSEEVDAKIASILQDAKQRQSATHNQSAHGTR